MNPFHPWSANLWRIAVLAFTLLAGPVSAELSLDRQFPWSEEAVGFELEGVHSLEAAVRRDQIHSGLEGQRFYETRHFFRMRWGTRTFYVAGIQYRSKAQNVARDAALAMNKHAGPMAGGGLCAVFVYDEQLRQVAKHDVQLHEANGRTWCNGVNALASVRGQDALLFSISYYLTDKPVAKRGQDIGDDWRRMTVLLTLRDQDGRILIEQDDACLGNPNLYKDIGAARKALMACQ